MYFAKWFCFFSLCHYIVLCKANGIKKARTDASSAKPGSGLQRKGAFVKAKAKPQAAKAKVKGVPKRPREPEPERRPAPEPLPKKGRHGLAVTCWDNVPKFWEYKIGHLPQEAMPVMNKVYHGAHGYTVRSENNAAIRF